MHRTRSNSRSVPDSGKPRPAVRLGRSGSGAGSGGMDRFLLGKWRTTYNSDGVDISVEYHFHESGSGFERIRFRDGTGREEINQLLWSVRKPELKITYITEPAFTVRMRCHRDGEACAIFDVETGSMEMILER